MATTSLMNRVAVEAGRQVCTGSMSGPNQSVLGVDGDALGGIGENIY